MTGDNSREAAYVPDRPDPEDIIYGELNLERWPNIWNTGDGKELRVLRKPLRYPDGSTLDTTITIEPSQQSGDLTTDACKLFSVLLAMRQDIVGPRALANIDAERIPMVLRQVAARLQPNATRAARWGKKRHDAILRGLEKLNKVNVAFTSSFWNAKKGTRQNVKGGFNLVCDYYVLEERRYRVGEPRQLPLELGHFRINPFVIENLAAGYHAPFYLSERLKLSGFALVLYNQLDLKMASRDRYERDIAELFESDFPEMGRKYPAPSQRVRELRKAITRLANRRMTSGQILELQIATKKRGQGSKLIVRKSPFPLRLIEGGAANPEPSEEQTKRNLLVDDILEVTHHPESTAFYHLTVKHLDPFIVRRFLAEIRADEAGNFEGSRGMLFFVKVRDYCEQEGIAPFWKAA